MSWKAPEIAKNLYDPSYDSEAIAQKVAPPGQSTAKDGALVQENGQFRKGRKVYEIGEDGLARPLHGVLEELYVDGRWVTAFVTDGLYRPPWGPYSLYRTTNRIASRIEGAQFVPNVEMTDGSMQELFVHFDPEDRTKGYAAKGDVRYLVELVRDMGLATGGKLVDIGARADGNGNVFFIDLAATKRFREEDIAGLFGKFGAYAITGARFNDVRGVARTERGYVLVRRLKDGHYVHSYYDSDRGIVTLPADREIIPAPR